jgi:methyl-accepting chemotaxis protein/methyl-accepting chemotaxis protein-2 (aspartate sensor receptor)
MKSDDSIVKKYVTYLMIVIILGVIPATTIFVKYDQSIFDHIIKQRVVFTENNIKKMVEMEKASAKKNIEFISAIISNVIGQYVYDGEYDNAKKVLMPFMQRGNLVAISVYDASYESDFITLYKSSGEIKVTKEYVESLSSYLSVKKEAFSHDGDFVGTVSVYYDLNTLNHKVEKITQKRAEQNKKYEEYIDNQFMKSMTIKFVGLAIGIVLLGIAILYVYRLIRKKMNKVVKTVDEIGQEIYKSSSNITSLTDNLKSNVDVQSSKMDNISVGSLEIKSQIDKNYEDSKEADKLSAEANLRAKEGYGSVKELSSAMEDIRDSSNRISNIIQTIDEIAFQTNLLALNAAVEAARAGEHGTGFAVVAEEVRALASKSSEAAKQITDIIGSSVEQVDYGTKVSYDVVKSFEEILHKVSSTTELISNITQSTTQQIGTVTELADSIKDVKSITININSDFNLATESSHELFSSIQKLNQSIELLKK